MLRKRVCEDMSQRDAVIRKGTQFLADKIWNLYNSVARKHNLPDPISHESIAGGIELKSFGIDGFNYAKLQALPYVLRVLESPSGDQLMAAYEELSRNGLHVVESGFLDREEKLYYVLTNEKKCWVPDDN
jgi:hypothetical protein